MGKRIVILNGSPRKSGNTAMLIEAFSEGAKAAGHSVERFTLQEMDIHPCIGCLKGDRQPVEDPCTQKDAMAGIFAAYRQADVLVLASPLYWWSFTAQLKMALDRLFAVTEADDYKIPPMDCVLLMAAEEDSAQNWEPIEHYYAAILGRTGWKDKGKVLAGGVNEVGDIAKRPEYLEQAEALGKSLE